MNVRLEKIDFNTPRAAAIHIGSPPNGGPEDPWMVPSALTSAACLPLDALASERSVRVTVQLTATALGADELFVEAEPMQPHVLGAVMPTLAERVLGRADLLRATVDLDARSLMAGGVDRHTLVWRWRWKTGNSRAIHELGLSEHLVFVTAARPTDPWSPRARPSVTLASPWLGVLAQACTWARGSRTPDQAVAAIVRHMYERGESRFPTPGRLRYSEQGYYISEGLGQPKVFRSVAFLRQLAGFPIVHVNCSDAAAVLMSFGNLHGAALSGAHIDSNGLAFTGNCVWPLGQAPGRCGLAFHFHDVAIQRSGGSVGDALVLDGSMRIDRDAAPNGADHDWTIASGMALGTASARPGNGFYLPQLISADSIALSDVSSEPPPRIRLPQVQTHIRLRDLERYRHYLTLLERRVATPRLPQTFSLPGYTAYPPSFVDPPIPRAGLPKLPPAIRTWYEKPGSPEGVVLESVFWADDDPDVTRSVMAELLAGLELRPRVVQLGLGQAYSTPSGTAVFVLLPGAVARLASIGATPVDVVAIMSTATPE